jgi:hypothetical protein
MLSHALALQSRQQQRVTSRVVSLQQGHDCPMSLHRVIASQATELINQGTAGTDQPWTCRAGFQASASQRVSRRLLAARDVRLSDTATLANLPPAQASKVAIALALAALSARVAAQRTSTAAAQAEGPSQSGHEASRTRKDCPDSDRVHLPPRPRRRTRLLWDVKK